MKVFFNPYKEIARLKKRTSFTTKLAINPTQDIALNAKKPDHYENEQRGD